MEVLKRIQKALTWIGGLFLSKRRYEGGSRSDRFKHWKTNGKSADSVASMDVRTVRNRVRYLYRNNSYVKRAVNAMVVQLIGTGLVGECEDDHINARLFNAAYENWATSRMCDKRHRRDLKGLQDLAVSTLIVSGAVFIRAHFRHPNKMPGIVPLQIEVLEPDYLDTSKFAVYENGSYVKRGIQYDDENDIEGYWLYEKHPGDTYFFSGGNMYQSHFVSKDFVEYVYDDSRAGQTIGMSWLETLVTTAKDYDDYEDAQLLRQKIANCFAAFVHDIDPPEDSSKMQLEFDKIEPAAVEALPPGRQVTFANPPGTNSYGEFSTGQKQKMAAGTAILTYEEFTNDLSKVNFSSARIGQQSMYQASKRKREILIVPQLCDTIKVWFCRSAYLNGYIRSCAVSVTWTPPAREFLEPVKDSNAANMRVQYGQESYFDMLRSRGYNPRKFVERYAKEKEIVEKLGLHFFSNSPNIEKESKGGTKDDATDNNENDNTNKE